MSSEPTPRQVLAIWRMLFIGETPMSGDLAKRLGKRGTHERQQLVDQGLIELRPARRGRGKVALLTDKAWDWAAENLDSKISESKLAAPALEALLRRIKISLGRLQIGLADLLGEVDQDESRLGLAPTTLPRPLEETLKEAYFAISGGRSNHRVRLADLRKRLAGVKRQQLDAFLIEMQRQQKVVLNTINDPREIQPEDRQAALEVAGVKRHLIYMEC